jgi:hypothetical protein
MLLETTDGVAIVGYAGLGATALGTEPADWMSAVLRGRHLPLEHSLGVLAKAMQEQLPKHMVRIPLNHLAAHHVIVPAFIEQVPRLYSIDLVFAPDRKSYRFQYTRYATPPKGSPPRLAIGGSGALRLMQDKAWMRNLLCAVKANQLGKVSTHAVADYLAMLNDGVAATDEWVGPRCIVAWRFRSEGFHKGGGGQAYYTGRSRDADSPALPAIANGMDMKALVEAMMPWMSDRMDAMLEGEPASEWNMELTRLPRKADETLR